MRLRPDFLVVAAVGLTPATQAAAADSGADRARKELATLEREWVDAEMNRDSAALQRILDDQFVCTFLTSKPLGKSEFIKAEMRPGPKGIQDLSDETVIISGDTAVVVETDTLRGVRNGTPYVETARVTVTYIKRGGHWRALAEQMAWDTKPPPPKT